MPTESKYDSAIVDAPITISGERFVCEVVITRKQDNRFYLHEVTPIKKLQNAVSLTNSGQSPTAHLGVAAKILKNIVSASDNVSKNQRTLHMDAFLTPKNH